MISPSWVYLISPAFYSSICLGVDPEVTPQGSHFQGKPADSIRSVGFEVHHILLHVAEFEARRLPSHNSDNELEESRTEDGQPLGKGLDPSLKAVQHFIKPGKVPMKKLIPLNSLIEASSVVDLDNEWLFNYPEFLKAPYHDGAYIRSFTRTDPGRFLHLVALGMNESLVRHYYRLMSHSPPTGNFRSLADEANLIDAKLWGLVNSEFSRDILGLVTGLDSSTRTNFVADTPKRRYLSRQQRRPNQLKKPEPLSYGELDDKLKRARSAANAKKRFIWLPRANALIAVSCWAASIESERIAMSSFFDHHSKYQNQLWDDATMVLNTWQTELHLSFYVLVNKKDRHTGGLPDIAQVPFPGVSEKAIRRAAMGFRFDGDFFDRYWTCHFIQNIPSRVSFPDNGVKHTYEWDFDLKCDGAGTYQDKRWWQRKVLELYLLQRILKVMVEGSNAILDRSSDELGIKETTLFLSLKGVVNRETYTSCQDKWKEFEHILEAVEDDLSSSLDTLEKWKKREGDRGREKPRWTRNDERKYRGEINKLRAETERQIWEIGSQQKRIHKLRAALTISRENLRDDLEISREGNIRYFTYVTVIFLPLGFATGLYSMNGPPQLEWIVPLVKSSAIAFSATIALILCSRPLFAALRTAGQPLSRSVKHIWKFSSDTRQNSWLHRAQVYTKQQDSGYYMSTHWFWIGYIFLEIPARNVYLAYSVLRSGPSPSWTKFGISFFRGVICLPFYGISRLAQVFFLALISGLKVLGEFQAVPPSVINHYFADLSGWIMLWCAYKLTAHDDFPLSSSAIDGGNQPQKMGSIDDNAIVSSSANDGGNQPQNKDSSDDNTTGHEPPRDHVNWLLAPAFFEEWENSMEVTVRKLAGHTLGEKNVNAEKEKNI